MIAVSCQQVSHSFGRQGRQFPVLDDISIEFHSGRSYLLMGPSGSGKTTLLSIVGCLLAPSRGGLTIGAEAVRFDDQNALLELRRRRIGFVFQQPHLLPFQTVRQQLTLIGWNAGLSRREIPERIAALLARLHLLPFIDHYPAELSGGQQQRAAIARALLPAPAIVLADEPTAALDWERGQAAVKLLLEHARELGAMLLTVSHDARLKPLFDVCLELDDGRLRTPSVGMQ